MPCIEVEIKLSVFKALVLAAMFKHVIILSYMWLEHLMKHRFLQSNVYIQSTHTLCPFLTIPYPSWSLSSLPFQ